jgi:class 3 adenylate cyclase/tetratricopeptide (TPR) repeat protein
MRCPKCHVENPETKTFCRECGAKLLLACSQCGAEILPSDNFCGDCGQRLEEIIEKEKTVPETEGERKQVTVLFSDLSGYTAISEKLDPEEVKEIMSRIFGEIAHVVTEYEGFIEKFVGDAVMALFGVPKAHEDDPIRAIRAAREIHELVDAISPQVEERIGQPISMHTGINTGLVVTGEVDMEKGTHGVAGDTINLSSRLSSLAKAGEILVGLETYRQAEGHFTFEDLEPTRIKGKAEPVPVYKVLSPKERPTTTHRPSGLRAELIGRKVELTELEEAVQRLSEGKGTIISICGDTGTGKSRLVEEFRATLDLEEIQWLEGHAYAYSQNIPYFPLIDLLNRAWQIEEGDPPEGVKEKIESRIQGLIGKKADVAPYIGSLYALSYPEVEGVSPEFWKSRLHDAVQAILSALTRRGPTVICLEDIQWADPSSLDLLRFILSEFRYPALFLCVYRLPFSLLTSHQLSGIGKSYQEIRLQDLSPSDTQDMMESLLRSKTIPQELRKFVQQKVEGNPFYLEEVINSLIESGTLTRDNGNWMLTRPIGESDILPTIQGVISARLDRLEKEMKRILQEASVIGRAFLYEILRKITELKDDIDRCLHGLEQLDLIRTRSFQPELEYVFKHALTQEVVYSGLLKKERQEIHEQIARVMEQLFQDRLPEFYETLAFHFKRGQSVHKAVDYLMKSGEKSLRRYAVEESHQYYTQAFDLLAKKPDKTKEEEGILIDLLIKWAYVFYYRGDFRGLTTLLSAHEELAASLDDKARLGMFYAWLGFGWYCGGKLKDSYHYLCKALKIGEEIENQQVIGYACTWLSWTCADLGLLDEAVTFGERAQEISRSLESDQYLYFKSLGGLGYAYHHRGEMKKALEATKALVEFGQSHSNIRSLVMGHWIMGLTYIMDGDFPMAIECSEKAIQISADPFYSQFARLGLGISHSFGAQFQEAEDALQEVVNFSQKFGSEGIGRVALIFLGAITIAKGQMGRGLKMLEEVQRACLENEGRWPYAISQYVLGNVYLQIVEGAGPKSLSTMAKNIGFLMKNVPFASKKAEDHFNKAIEVAKKIGAKGSLGRVYLDLGLLHEAKGRIDKARECISEAIRVFEQCEVETYLKQAKEALDSLG